MLSELPDKIGDTFITCHRKSDDLKFKLFPSEII